MQQGEKKPSTKDVSIRSGKKTKKNEVEVEVFDDTSIHSL